MSRGTFTISLDTELAWGLFDIVDIADYAAAYRRTPAVVDGICSLFAEYEVSATWAVVAHLLHDCASAPGHAELAPMVPEEQSWYASVPCETGMERDLWFAPAMIERIRDCDVEQEVGMHGYTHLVLADDRCPRPMAAAELRRGRAVLERNGIEPESFVFPRNEVGNLDVLREAGFTSFRGVDARWHETTPLPEPVRKGLRFADEAAGWTPPAVSPTTRDGLVEIPGSQILRPAHGWWGTVPTERAVQRARKGLERAADTGRLFHLWFHPFNLATHPDELLDALERILSHAAELRAEGRLEVAPMRRVAADYRA